MEGPKCFYYFFNYRLL